MSFIETINIFALISSKQILYPTILCASRSSTFLKKCVDMSAPRVTGGCTGGKKEVIFSFKARLESSIGCQFTSIVRLLRVALAPPSSCFFPPRPHAPSASHLSCSNRPFHPLKTCGFASVGTFFGLIFLFLYPKITASLQSKPLFVWIRKPNSNSTCLQTLVRLFIFIYLF